MNPYMLLMFAGTLFTAISQVLLKQSASRTYRHPIYEYLNWRVILSYGIFFGVLLLNTYAYTRVDMKYGAVIDTCSYLFVMLLSWLILKERFSKGRLAGNLIILTGIFIYTLPV
ncbi:MAG: EamA family transporter [Blautia sp.]|jgi:drug/metabolite transporter (DMT)-like permease